VVILPGNGCSPVLDANWYGEIQQQLIDSELFEEVVLRDMPDPFQAREEIWIPFVVNDLKIDTNTIVIGHSSGAVAAMRLLERHRLMGCVLVSACWTDLGDEGERLAGYYGRPWEWDRIKANAAWILQYHSADDPFIPRAEADHVAAQLGSQYTCFRDRSHFFGADDLGHLLPDLRAKLTAAGAATA
jgi:uncharacterized protein